MPHPKIPGGVPREIDLFSLSSSELHQTIAQITQNLTSLLPSVPWTRRLGRSDQHWGWFLPWRAPASVKRRPEVAGRGAPLVVLGGGSWVPGSSRHARQAGRALDTDRVQGGQREESSAQRGRGAAAAGFHRSASEKSSGRGPRAGAASEKRPVQRGILCLF